MWKHSIIVKKTVVVCDFGQITYAINLDFLSCENGIALAMLQNFWEEEPRELNCVYYYIILLIILHSIQFALVDMSVQTWGNESRLLCWYQASVQENLSSDTRLIAGDSKTLIQLLLNPHHSFCWELSYRIKGLKPLPEDVTFFPLNTWYFYF